MEQSPGRSGACADYLWQAWEQAWDCGGAVNAQAVAEIIPEGDAEFGAGLGDAEERIAYVTTGVASGPAGDFTLGDVTADVIFRSVGVERDFGTPFARGQSRTTRRSRRLAWIRLKLVEQPRAGSAPEDPIEPGAQAGTQAGTAG